jgi:hypothetical protein
VVTTGANLGFSYALATLINNWFYRKVSANPVPPS